MDLWEVSPVTFAANRGAKVTAVAAALKTAWERHCQQEQMRTSEQYEGRMISAENEALLSAAIVQMGTALDQIKGLIAKAKASTPPAQDEPIVNYQDDIRDLEVQLFGVLAKRESA